MGRLERRIRRRLLRDPENGWLGGVCEGIGRATHIPSDAVRVAVVIAGVLFTTLTVVAYGAAWLFMDSRDEDLSWRRSSN